ncbi:MAG: aminopeptidase [Betaproteobacteria bacterium]
MQAPLTVDAGTPRGGAAAWGLLAVLLALIFLPRVAAADPLHWGRAVVGHLAVMQAARPIESWLDDPSTPVALRERLQLAQAVRQFASTQLALPDNASYRRYADLGRPAVLWNVVAAPAWSLELKTWCYPVAGCVGYRGHFHLARAQQEAQALREQGWEVQVVPVSAYSTLGWTNWMGGDPVLNTFATGSPIELARLIFHELAHQVAYASGDMAFSEGYATAVEQLGLEQWASHPSAQAVAPAQWQAWQQLQLQRRELQALVQAHKAELVALYRAGQADAQGLARKAELKAQLQAQFAQWRNGRWPQERRFDAWVEGLNNAGLALLGSYQDPVPAFRALFEREGRDFARFHAAVKALAAADRAVRWRTLHELCPECPAMPSARPS